MLLSLTEVLGTDPRRTLMIGDTSHDLLMANNAGRHGVGVSFGAHDSERLESCQPLALFHSTPS